MFAEQYEKHFTFLGENTEKYIKNIITVPIEKDITRTDKKGEHLQKIYPANYNLMIAPDIWKVLYQLLSTIIL